MIPKILLAAILIAHGVGSIWLALYTRQKYRGAFERMMTPWQRFYLHYGWMWVVLPTIEAVLLTWGDWW